MKVILCYKTQVNTHLVWLVIFTKLNQNNAQYSVHSFCTGPNTKLAYFPSNYLFLSSYVTSGRLTTENWNVLDLAEIFHQTALLWAGHSAEDQDSELYTNATNVPEKDLENLIFQVKYDKMVWIDIVQCSITDLMCNRHIWMVNVAVWVISVQYTFCLQFVLHCTAGLSTWQVSASIWSGSLRVSAWWSWYALFAPARSARLCKLWQSFSSSLP